MERSHRTRRATARPVYLICGFLHVCMDVCISSHPRRYITYMCCGYSDGYMMTPIIAACRRDGKGLIYFCIIVDKIYNILKSVKYNVLL